MKSRLALFLLVSILVISLFSVCNSDDDGFGRSRSRSHGQGDDDDGESFRDYKRRHIHRPKGNLKKNTYSKSCPQVEDIVKEIVWGKVAKDLSLAAKLLRLHYHDCFVRGCDASILLDSKDGKSAEKDAIPNRSVTGYEIIDEIKARLENECPDIVSCADIVAIAARDAVSYQFKKPLWKVFTGRKDGRVSIAAETFEELPSGNANFTTLLKIFTDNGLGIPDLVALSGAHTIGVTHCAVLSKRLFNFTGQGDTDSSLDQNYAKFLKRKCPNPLDRTVKLELDRTSSLKFDNHYFQALNAKKGLLRSDAELLTDPRAAKLVRRFRDFKAFMSAFTRSVKNMGDMQIITAGVDGEIRKNCRRVN